MLVIKYLQTIFLILYLTLFAQAQTTYYDLDWEETTKDKAVYYRQITPSTPPDTLIHIQDFYANGTRQSDGYVTTLKYYDNYAGRVNWYYPNGQLEHFTTYHPETLKKFGPATWYLKDGALLAKGTYEYGSAFDGIVRNYTYALRFTKVNNGKLISRLDFYDNSHQVAHEQFYFSDNFRIKEDVYYDKKGLEIGRLKYLDESGMQIDSGIKIDFYRSDYTNLSVKTTRHYANQKAEGEQITYHPNGQVWTKGINKNHRHFDGEFLDDHNYMLVKKGTVIKTHQYDKNWKIKATLLYKNNKIWEGTEEGIFATDIYKRGKHIQRIEYFAPPKKIIKSRKTYGDESHQMEWFDKSGKKIGTGFYKDYDIWEGLNIQYSMNTTLFSHYKNGKKEGLEKLYDEKDVLLSEKVYQEGQVIKDKTRNPLTGEMVDCAYQNGRAYNGSFFEYNDEAVFKNGVLVQENIYTENNRKYTLSKSIYYNPNKENKIIKQIIFDGDSTYTLLYKDGKKYNGTDKTEYRKITYTNGEKTGPFVDYVEGKPSIQGTLKDGSKHGHITSYYDHQTFHCKYNDGKPINGTEVSDSWSQITITDYKNGKKHGKIIFKYNNYTKTEHYENGVQTGTITWKLDNGTSFSGTTKDGQPYHGDFYDPEFHLAESYVNGQKNGLHKSNFGAIATLSEKFNNGIKTWEQVGYAIGDAIFSEGTFQNGHPYNGIFAQRVATDYHYLTPYVNGKKQGKEVLYRIYNPIEKYGYTHYQNDKKEGEYLLTASDFLPKGIKEAKGIYKNNHPYSGTFITNENYKILSTYNNGSKNGIEISEMHGTIDTLFYENGKPMNGIQKEVAHSRPNNFFSHKYINGKKVSSIHEFLFYKFAIVYTPNGFKVRYLYNESAIHPFEEVALFHFKNKKHTKGSIELFEKNQSIGKLYFKKGNFYKGEIKTKDFTIFPKGKLLIAQIHTPTKKYTTSEKYFLPKRVTYQDFTVLDDVLGVLLKDAHKQ